eukprot:TRINITY_DN2269_c0_g1_i2.p1 TRINITY_DN2269_c0_g1~~TRINITY_DN2269_c0_g1_i2.p1  ORF type:complete len:419 (-),score=120.91 TRINITY_DN2269_c0_g1_i2:42-1160(-)
MLFALQPHKSFINTLTSTSDLPCFKSPKAKIFFSSKTQSNKSRMKAVLVTKDQGGGHPLLSIGDAEKPTVKEGHLLVRIKATAVNRADLLQSEGKYPVPPGESQILGLEMAGEVEEVGQGCDQWKKGDRVCALLGGGGYAEYVSIPATMAIPVPHEFSFEQAAAVPEAFLTAFQTVFWLGNLEENGTLLIHAGASGVGSAAIQLAKMKKSRVIVTAGSDDKVEFCKKIGADLAINYKTQDFVHEVMKFTENKGVSVLVDCVGADYWEKNLQCLGLDSHFVVIGFLSGTKANSFNMAPILGKRITIHGTTLRSRSLAYKEKLTQDFVQTCLQLFVEGKLVPVVDKVFDWSQATDAHRYVRENKNLGKVVLNKI